MLSNSVKYDSIGIKAVRPVYIVPEFYERWPNLYKFEARAVIRRASEPAGMTR